MWNEVRSRGGVVRWEGQSWAVWGFSGMQARTWVGGRSRGRASRAEPGRGDKEMASSFKNWMDTHFALLQSWQDVFMDQQSEGLNKCISNIEGELAKFSLASPPDMAQTVKTVGIDCTKVDVLYLI